MFCPQTLRLVAAAVFLIGNSSPAWRQEARPTIGEPFSDTMGAVIPNAAAVVTSDDTAATQRTSAGTWTLTWSDEFNGANGSSPDPAKWVLETGGRGWGNQELETYTNRLENAQIQNGDLVITARRGTFTGKDGITRDYTSARLKTAGKFSQKYGRFEARIKIPFGPGIWPAFWMLGNNIGSVGWPMCGEIDIMENIGREPSVIHGSMHGPGASGGRAMTAIYTLPNGAKFSDEYHNFTVEWEPNTARFYVDGYLYSTKTTADLLAGATWVYDHPFFILLNLAVGGAWPGSPDATTTFPQTMLVDYVRVYARK